MIGRENPETSSITIKPETSSHVAEQFSRVPIACCSLPALLPNKVSCFVSSCVSSEISFLSVRQEPTLGPWKGSPFLQHFKRYGGIASGHSVISRVGVVDRAPRRTNLFDAQKTFPSRPCHFCLFLSPAFKIVQGLPAPQSMSDAFKGR